MTYSRKKLPKTRKSITHKAEMGPVEFYVTVGLNEDGTPGEVFIKAGNIDPKIEDDFGFQGWCDTIGELCSLCLQAGIPIKTLCIHLLGKSFKPCGCTKLTGYKCAHIAKSVPDYLAKWMMMTFCKEMLSGMEED